MEVLNISAELSFMLVGHTEFALFGLYKEFHYSSVSTYTEVSAIPEQAVN